MKHQPKEAKLAMLALSVALALAMPVRLQSQAGCIASPSGLADWWPGDGYATDIVGSHNGQVQGGLTFTPGFDGDAFTFNGSNAIATFGQAGNFGIADFTVVFWLRTTSQRGEAVIEKRPSCGNDHFWGIRKGGGNLAAETDDGQGNYIIVFSSGSPLNDGAFHLIGLVRQGKNTLLYVDAMSPVVGTANNVADVGNSAALIVGDSICDGVDGTNHLTGQLDEIQTFNRALSAAEILSIYDAVGQCKNVTLSPASLDFGSQVIHTTSTPQTVTLINPGNSTLDISSIAASADFYQRNKCGTSLLPGASCTINVTFRASTVCEKNGALTITDNAPGSPQTVKLTGISTAVTMLPSTVNFGDQAIGTTSQPQTVTFTNHATNRALNIFAVRLTGINLSAFAQTNTCGTTVAAGASCTFTVIFAPQHSGAKTATLNVWDDGGGTPHQVTLTGRGD